MLIPGFNLTRIAPTPSGYLHLGNAYSFIITCRLAKRHGAAIMLRIDDLDKARVQQTYVEDVFETLRFLGIDWSIGPKDYPAYATLFSQNHRVENYNNLLEQLRQRNLVYACSCSRSDIQQSALSRVYPGTCRHKHIDLDAPNVSWRLKTDEDYTLIVNSLQRPIEAKLTADMRDFVVRKKDGAAAYQLASLSDDLSFGVDLIIRGQDLWPSTLAQLYLARALEKKEFLEASFHHHALLNTANGEKLSKSAGDTSVRYLRGQGMKSEGLYQLVSKMAGLSRSVTHWQDWPVDGI